MSDPEATNAPTEAKPPAPSGAAVGPVGKLFGGCLKIALEILIVLATITVLPFVVLGALVHWLWPWYSSVPPPRNLNDALIAIASVAGVLWSGSIVAYSIHRRYTPPLRTGVQLLHFAILAPLAGLIAQGAEMRTIFYFITYFYVLSTLFSITNLEMLKPGKFTLRVPGPVPNESPAAAKLRQDVAALRLKNIEFFKRVAHGTRYFALVSALGFATFITAKVTYIAWSCLIVLVVSLFLILPEIFSLVDVPEDDARKPGP